MANLAARLAAAEKRAAAKGLVKAAAHDWRRMVAPGMAAQMHRDADGLLWYQPTPEERAEIDRILNEARNLAHGNAVQAQTDDDWEPGYLPEPEPKDYLTKHN